MYIKFICFMLILTSTTSFAFINNNIVLHKDTPITKKFSLPYYYDQERKLTIDEIQEKKFEISIPSQFTLGYIDGNVWFKFKITNKSQKNKFILYLNEPLFDKVNFFEFTNNTWLKDANGLSVNLENRSIKDSNPAFAIEIMPGSTKTYYIQTFAKYAQFGEFQIITQNEFMTYHKLNIFSLYLFYFGSAIVVMMLISYLFFTLKDKVYAYYVAYMFFHTIFVFGYSGLGIYAGLAPWYYEIGTSIPLFVILIIMFSTNFLKIKQYLPKIYKILMLTVFGLASLAILTLIEFNPWFYISTYFASLSAMILMYASIYILLKGLTEAKYYVIAMTLYMTSTIIMAFMASGWLEHNNFSRYTFLYSSFFEMVLFALLLVDRFYKTQHEKIKIQDELLHIKDKNEYFLQNEVENRTIEINQINKDLKNLLEERELLLKEVYHRVKNNFQIVISMLSLEAFKNKDISFTGLINRIKSMALVHQFLYSTETLSQIQADKYLEKIIDETKRAYVKENIQIKHKIDNALLSMDEAMALGIIINEVLTNSIKHNNSDSCSISLAFNVLDKNLELTIIDNGKGFDIESLKNSTGLGIKLVKQFSKKLKNANFDFKYNNGTKFRLVFEPI